MYIGTLKIQNKQRKNNRWFTGRSRTIPGDNHSSLLAVWNLPHRCPSASPERAPHLSLTPGTARGQHKPCQSPCPPVFSQVRLQCQLVPSQTSPPWALPRSPYVSVTLTTWLTVSVGVVVSRSERLKW